VIDYVRQRWFAFATTAVAAILCAPSVLGFGRVAASRLNEPYALWWLEPLFYRAALASHQGLPLYPSPNLEYTPPIYNPGLNVVGGALISIFDAGYPGLRWFSFLCFVGLACVLAAWAWRESRSAALSLVTLTLVAALQAPMRNWVTAINVDTPSLCFGFLGLFLVTAERLTHARVIGAGLCVTLGFAFKQPACLLALPALTHLLSTDRKLALWFAVACGGSALALVTALYVASDGWYWTYAFSIPLQTPKRDVDFSSAWLELHRWSAISVALGPLVLTALGPKRLLAFWLPLMASAVAMAYGGFTKDGGDRNTLLPAFVAGVLCLVSLPVCAPRLSSMVGRVASRAGSYASAALVISVALGGVWIAQGDLAEFRADGERLHASRTRHATRSSSRFITHPRLSAFEESLRELIARLPQPVFVGGRFFGPRGPLNTHQTGQYEGTSRTHLFDLEAQIAPQLASHHYKSLVLWSYWHDRAFTNVVKRYYKRGDKIGADPLIGLHIHVWLPRKPKNEGRE